MEQAAGGEEGTACKPRREGERELSRATVNTTTSKGLLRWRERGGSRSLRAYNYVTNDIGARISRQLSENAVLARRTNSTVSSIGSRAEHPCQIVRGTLFEFIAASMMPKMKLILFAVTFVSFPVTIQWKNAFKWG